MVDVLTQTLPAPPPGAAAFIAPDAGRADGDIDDVDCVGGGVFDGGVFVVVNPGIDGAVDEALTPYQCLTPLWPRHAPCFFGAIA